jgi:hypothetical protein
MTTTVKAPRKSGARNQAGPARTSPQGDSGTALVTRNLAPVEGLVVGGEPRVHLLPPQVMIDRKGRVVRRRLGIGVLAVLVLVAVGFGAASLSLVNSQANLLTAQNDTSSILQQQAKYGDVLKVKADASAIQSSQKLATAQEILWQPFYTSFEATVPAGGKITSLSAALDNPFGTTAPSSQTPGPLDGTHIATVTGTLTMPQAAISGWLNSLPSLKGFVDVTPTSVAAAQAGVYTVSFTMHINKDLLANRFTKTAGGTK